MKTIDNGTLHVNAEVFIVPNSLSSLGAYKDMGSIYKSKREILERICSANGITITDDTKLVELWWTATEDLSSENLCDHGASFMSDEGRCYISYVRGINYLPVTFFKDKKEGDVLTIKVPGNKYFLMDSAEDEPEEKDVEIIFTVTLSQSKYRYRRFGNFEEVLTKLGA